MERRPVAALDPQFLLSLQANEPALVRRLAFDVEALRRWTARVEESDDVVVTKHVLAESTPPILVVEIDCRVSGQIGLRIDRLLASELHLSRSCIQRLGKSARIAAVPPGSSLRQSLRDGMRLVIEAAALPESSLLLAAQPSDPSSARDA